VETFPEAQRPTDRTVGADCQLARLLNTYKVEVSVRARPWGDTPESAAAGRPRAAERGFALHWIVGAS